MAEVSKAQRANKIALSLFIFFAVLFCFSLPLLAATMGDLNSDGAIDINDVVLLNGYVLGNSDLTSSQKEYADLNGDGKIDLYDNILLMQMVVGLIDSFPLPPVASEAPGPVAPPAPAPAIPATPAAPAPAAPAETETPAPSLHQAAGQGAQLATPLMVPQAPVLKAPGDGATLTGRSVSFQWEAVEGAEGYELEIIDNKTGAYFFKGALGNVTTLTQRGFEDDGSSYRWRVRARGKGGWGAWSAYRNFVSGAMPEAPVLVSPENKQVIKHSWVNFEWQPVTGADRYQVKISDENGVLYPTINVGNRNTVLVKDIPVDGSGYTWQVRSGNANAYGSWSATRNFTVGAPVGRPELITPGVNAYISPAGAVYSADFSWEAVPKATCYQLEVAKVRGGNIKKVMIEDGSTVGTTISDFFEDEEQYRWRLRAGKSVGIDDLVWGEWSAERDFIYYADAVPKNTEAPLLKSPASGATVPGSKVFFKWTANQITPNKYELQVARAENGSNFISVNNITPNGEFTGEEVHDYSSFPDDGTIFIWRVRAIKDGATGPWSFYRIFVNGSYWWNTSF